MSETQKLLQQPFDDSVLGKHKSVSGMNISNAHETLKDNEQTRYSLMNITLRNVKKVHILIYKESSAKYFRYCIKFNISYGSVQYFLAIKTVI